MITQPGRYPVSAEHIATGNKYTYSEADDVVGVVQSTTDAANSPATHADVSNADGAHQADQAIHSSADGGHSPTQESANLTVLIPADDHTYSLDESHATASSTTDLSPVPATSGWFSDDHLSGIFDHIESLSNGPASVGSLSDGVTTSYNDDQGGFPSAGPTTSPSLSFDSPDSTAIDVFSQAKSHGGGGGSTGGGTVPAAVTISSPLTDVSFHITWDSSVGSAPSGFVSAVESVASFFAGAFNQPHPITINIDVGYGEVGGTRLGPSALGESESYLQSVSYSQLASLYSAGDVTPRQRPLVQQWC